MSDPLAPEAVPAWLAEHGLAGSDAVASVDGTQLWWPERAVLTRAWDGGAFTGSVADWLAPPDHLAVLLVRRGGYAVGLADGGALVAHKCGTRYVQSRTAAGGWSQQRFQRRRENQAAGLLDAAAGHLMRLVTEHTGEAASGAAQRWIDGFVLGGDKLLLGEVTGVEPLSSRPEAPRRTFADIPDPDLKTLRRTLWRARSVTAELLATG